VDTVFLRVERPDASSPQHSTYDTSSSDLVDAFNEIKLRIKERMLSPRSIMGILLGCPCHRLSVDASEVIAACQHPLPGASEDRGC
jgi:hypothetical protein